MKIELSAEGANYLLRKLETDLEYYRTLAGSGKCSPNNRAKWELVRELHHHLSGIKEVKEAA